MSDITWLATEADWRLLERERCRPSNEMVSLAFGMSPKVDAQLSIETPEHQARVDARNALAVLIVEAINDGSLRTVGSSLPSERGEIASNLRAYVDVLDFVEFANRNELIINERLWHIGSVPLSPQAFSTLQAHAESGSGAAASAQLERKQIFEGWADKGQEKQMITAAQALVALAMKHYGYQPYATSSQVSEGNDRGVYAPIANVCKELGLTPPGNWETVKKLLNHASTIAKRERVDAASAKLHPPQVP